MTICVKHFNQVLVYVIICPRLSDTRLIVRRLTVPRLYVRTPPDTTQTVLSCLAGGVNRVVHTTRVLNYSYATTIGQLFS